MSIAGPASPQFFVSYCVNDKKFVYEVCRLLEPYLNREKMFLFEKSRTLATDFLERMKHEMEIADCAIVFVGNRFSAYQWGEVADAIVARKRMCFVGIGGQEGPGEFPDEIRTFAAGRQMIFDRFTSSVPPDDVGCAKSILETLSDWMKAEYREQWKPWTDEKLRYGPKSPQLFDYEKKIIEFFVAKQYYEQRDGALGDAGLAARKSANHYKKLLEQWPLEKINDRLEKGAPGDWPSVRRYATERDNLLDQRKAGDFRAADDGDEALVRAAALLGLDPPGEQSFTFPEAGPRPKLAFPQTGSSQELNVGVLVAGGIAPGINAVIDAIVQRHGAYQAADRHYRLQVLGIRDGFLAITGGALSSHIQELKTHDTIEQATRGGSMLGTSRDEELLSSSSRVKRLRTIAEALSQPGRVFDILYIIGGDGGMKAGHALWRMAKQLRSESQHEEIRGREMSVVAIPKTMDNDILWVWQSFGFLSAVDESRKIVETLHTEVRSNPRLGIVQLFGSDSGFVVSHAVLAAAVGHATLALIPEIKFSAIGVARYLKERLWRAACPGAVREDLSSSALDAPIDPNFPHGLVVMAETAIPWDALECLGLKDPPPEFASSYNEIAKRFTLSAKEKEEVSAFIHLRKRTEYLGFEGQTNDTVRQVGLRLLAEAIPVFIQDKNLRVEYLPHFKEPMWKHLRVVCSEPRHLVRALEPSTSDIINGQRLGLLAVDAAMAGYTDCLISQWLTEFALVPLELAVLGRKRIPSQGMFWKSVTSKTGQPADLVSPYPLEAEVEKALSAS